MCGSQTHWLLGREGEQWVAVVWGDPLKPTHCGDRWRAGCWRVPGAVRSWQMMEGWVLHQSRACPVCPARKQAYFRFIRPSNAQLDLCQPPQRPAPTRMNSLPYWLQSVPFPAWPACSNLGPCHSLPEDRSLSPAWGWGFGDHPPSTYSVPCSVPTACGWSQSGFWQ